ncbi:Hypothetical_protein [Hexamita inflata]|uniref:Hypothetical_protein n=1 Tax=Hexamita inflata TaxID=28002 RepID=A0AA86QUN8_9EUKA|nr:Hypothetical protein HINF_LOCUS40875 [Hexamita inflata]CAI9959704.1 Hypothetical protein HINF_LOCUS47349 [Hexamita inflata]
MNNNESNLEKQDQLTVLSPILSKTHLLTVPQPLPNRTVLNSEDNCKIIGLEPLSCCTNKQMVKKIQKLLKFTIKLDEYLDYLNNCFKQNDEVYIRIFRNYTALRNIVIWLV